MAFWSVFWGLLLLVCLLVFAGLAVVVAVGGYGDIQALFRRMDEGHREDG